MMKRTLLLFFLITQIASASPVTREQSVNDSFRKGTPPADSIEYALFRASQGDAEYRKRVRLALDRLHAPSAASLRLLSLAWLLFREGADEKAAREMAAKGTPLENDAGVTAWVRYYEISHEDSALRKAEAAAGRLKNPDGSGFLALYGATGHRIWLKKARSAIRPGTSASSARTLNRLFHYTGNATYSKDAEAALRAASLPVGEILLAEWELRHPPLHVTVVGSKGDPAAKALFRAALGYPSLYKRIEWWDPSEGEMPNPDVRYPKLPKAAAFACSNKSCSLPIFEPKALPTAVERLNPK